jgi:3-oxoacyl-[acyl-carrier protein] reductase
MPDYELSGKVVLITGGNTGIGAATARAFAAEGAHVCVAYLRAPELASALVEQIEARGGRALAYQIDLSQADALGPLLDSVEQTLGPIDVLINNAAHSETDGFAALTAELLDQHYAVNVRASALLTAEFGRRYQRGSGGRVINLTSGQGLGPMPGELSYVASKGAIEALTRTFAAELAPRGITVNAVDPGITETGWISDEQRAAWTAHAPFGRLGQPEDAARLIVFLASMEARWITGQIIHSRGGM